MKINLCAPFKDYSGFGEFARFFAYALIDGGADVSCETISLSSSNNKPIDLGIKGSLVNKKMTLNPKAHDFNVIFMIPPLFKPYKRKQAKYNIGFCMFEGDSLPDAWVEQCNDMDAIFVPSQWGRECFLKSGVKKPIFVVPAGMIKDECIYSKNNPEVFSFYSIFQWVERKNPANLLRAYFVAMEGKTDVQLVLKTYMDTRIDNNKDKISYEISKIKKDLKLDSYADIKVVTEPLSYSDVKNLHLTGDCFISAHRAEGWNMPLMEAMGYGKETIATNYSGSTQFADATTTHLIPYFKTPCLSLDSFAPFFNGRMMWAEPSVEHLIQSIRSVYDGWKSNAGGLGLAANNKIKNSFNEKTSFQSMMTAFLTLSKQEVK